jgi:hypothetical protein
MDIYQSAVDYLFTFPVFDSWTEMGSILRRAASGQPRDWQLPVIAPVLKLFETLGISPDVHLRLQDR